MASGTKSLNQSDRLVLESIFNPNLPFEESGTHAKETVTQLNDIEQEEEDVEWKRLETSGVQLAEKGELSKALDEFNKAIDLRPNKAASYNNRAQVYRLTGDVESAKADLEIAIEKSNGIGAAACQAFTQRALIRRLLGDDDGCRDDFKRAADLGSSFAKRQLVALNPYAALCNSMLSQMINKVQRGEPTDSGDPAA